MGLLDCVCVRLLILWLGDSVFAFLHACVSDCFVFVCFRLSLNFERPILKIQFWKFKFENTCLEIRCWHFNIGNSIVKIHF